MKTAVLLEPIPLIVPNENIKLTEIFDREVLDFYISELSPKCSAGYVLEFQRPIIHLDNGKTIGKLLHFISYLHSLRSYFQSKVNIYFCERCLIHFKSAVLFEKSGDCCSCTNGSCLSFLNVINTINLLYSTVFPSEPKIYIMGCLCKRIVLKKRPYIICGCIYSHNHLNHYSILKRIVRAETKIWKKIFDVSSLYCPSEDKMFDIIHRFKNHKNFDIIPLLRNVSYPEFYNLQIEFYNFCDPLFEQCLNVYCCFGNNIQVNRQKCLLRASSFKKLTYPNLRYYFRCFLSLYIKALEHNVKRNCLNFKSLRQKSLSLCPSYSDFFLLFGFFVYCRKVLKFSKNKSLLISKIMSNLVDTWNKRHILKALFEICNSYSTYFSCRQIVSMVKYDICGPVCIQENHHQIIKYILSNDDQVIVDNIESLHIINNQHAENLSTLPNLLDFRNIKYKTVFNPSNSFKNVAPSHDISKSKLPAFTTGKEEIDVIDGINIFSFETEPDLLEFTVLHNNKMGIDSDCISDSTKSNSGRIVPTKTRDITKIKGWRNKLFYMNKNDRNHINSLKNLTNSPVKYEGIDESKNQVREELSENNSGTKQELEVGGNKDVKHDDIMSITKKGLDLAVCKIKSLKDIDNLVNSLKSMYRAVLSKDDYFQNILNQTDTEKGIFESSALDHYLNNRSELKISFDIPQPFYMLPSNNSGRTSPEIPSDIKMAPPKIKSEEMKEKIKQLSSIDFIKNMQGDLSKRKFIWVHGRPIMIDHESKKAVSTCNSSKKRIASSDSLSELDDGDTEENPVKRMKITKQLEFPDSPFSDNSESNHSDEIVPRKPYLSLLNTVQVDDIDEKCNASNSLSKHKFPLIFPCTSVNKEHTDCAKLNQIQLVMVVNIGYNRPILREVVNNLEKLKKDTAVIDDMWAHLAASAVCRKKTGKKTVTRYLVPVVSESLIEVVKFNIENVSTNIGNLNELNVCSVYRSICDSRAMKEDKPDTIEVEIKDVVDNIVEYLAKKYDAQLHNIPYDPDVPDPQLSIKRPIKKVKKTKVERELKRLINVTLVDNRHGNENAAGKSSCDNEYCSKGCICSSLNGKLTSFHCGKLGCMFECSCDSKSKYIFKNVVQHGRNGTLARDESNWHQTVICKNNEIVEVKAGAGKSKREKKLPTRFRNNVLLGKEMNCLDIFPLSHENKKSPSPNKDKETKSKESKIKEKDVKPKEKDKDTKVKEKMLKLHERDKGIKLRDIETKSKEFSMIIKMNEKDDKIKGKHVETKNNDKCKEPIVNENCNDKFGKTLGNKVALPLKTSAKKADVKNKSLISVNLNQVLTLADVFVWCSIHSRYSCFCSAQVFILKNNRLVWKPTANRTHLTSKHMSQIVINKSMPKYHIYDRNAYCARTYGSVFNYKLRNSNPVFKSKRSNEMLNDVLSNTNSFLKIDYASINTTPSKVKPKIVKELDTNIAPIKVITNWSKQLPNIPNNLQLAPNVVHSISAEVTNRKRKELDDELVVDITQSGQPITNKDEIVLQNAKKRYRIGPAHFDGKGSYRPISCGVPAKTIFKQTSNDHTNNLTDQEIMSSLNVKEVKDVESNKPLPKYGLLCLTKGFGYLPIKEFTPKKLQVQDPLSEHVFHCFKDIESANKWLNRFFKNRIVFESLAVNLKWVIVKPGILKHSQPFDKSLLENPSKIINKDGFLVDITNLNKNAASNPINPKQYIINSSIEIQQADDPSKTRIIVNATEIKPNADEIPVKKAKISSVSIKDKNIISPNQSIIIKKPNAFLQRKNSQEDHFKINKAPSPNGNNHKAFFRLSSGSNPSNEGCFIPLVPKNISKESSFQIKNVNENSCKETEPADLLINKLSSNKSSTAISITDFLKQSQQQNLIIKRIPKTVPFNSKALPGKSILKTNFK